MYKSILNLKVQHQITLNTYYCLFFHIATVSIQTLVALKHAVFWNVVPRCFTCLKITLLKCPFQRDVEYCTTVFSLHHVFVLKSFSLLSVLKWPEEETDGSSSGLPLLSIISGTVVPFGQKPALGLLVTIALK
jgi:hypothetical protein